MFFVKSLKSTFKKALEIESGKKTKNKFKDGDVIITDQNFRPMYFSEKDNRLYCCKKRNSVGTGYKLIDKSVRAYTIQKAHDYILRSMEQIASDRPLVNPNEIDYQMLPFKNII